MRHGFKLLPRTACVLASIALGSCDQADRLTRDSSASPEIPQQLAPVGNPLSMIEFAGGIPFGTGSQPTSAFGERFNGAHRNILMGDLLSELEAIKSRGGKVSLMFAGNERHYKDADGHFSLSMWQARVDRFRVVDFTPFIDDGTIIGHFMIDEPNDPFNWNDQPVPGATLDEMGRYSKLIWPGLPTIVRAEPGYLRKYSHDYLYIDATWAQYASRKGSVGDFIQRNVADAQSLDVALVVGMNVQNGGAGSAPMTATEVQEWGSVLLGSSYPCAFISYTYDETYLAGAGIGEAMDALRALAQNRPTRSCRGATATPVPDPEPEPEAAATTTTITANDPDPSAPGQDVTVAVSVSSPAGTPGGQVDVTASGGSESCTVTLSDGAGSCSLALTETGDRTLQAAYAGNASYAESSAAKSRTVRASARDVEIAWASPSDITYGTALGAPQLNAAASADGHSVPGTFSYQPAAGTVLGAGQAQSLSVTFTPSDPGNYRSATGSVSIDVLPAAATVSWSVPSSVTVGPLQSSILNATAKGLGGVSIQGSFTYTPAAGTVLDATTSRVLSVSFTPSNANYAGATKTVSLAVRYPYSGFFEPVNNPNVLNRAKAGVAIPVRFSLGGNRPLPIFSGGSPEVRLVSCPSWTIDAIEQTVSASASSLNYESATGRYLYTWKTSTAWANTCRRLTFVFKDGTRREATFRFVR